MWSFLIGRDYVIISSNMRQLFYQVNWSVKTLAIYRNLSENLEVLQQYYEYTSVWHVIMDNKTQLT